MSKIVPKTNEARSLVENCIANFNVNAKSYVHSIANNILDHTITTFVTYNIINCLHSLNIVFRLGGGGLPLTGYMCMSYIHCIHRYI